MLTCVEVEIDMSLEEIIANLEGDRVCNDNDVAFVSMFDILDAMLQLQCRHENMLLAMLQYRHNGRFMLQCRGRDMFLEEILANLEGDRVRNGYAIVSVSPDLDAMLQ